MFSLNARCVYILLFFRVDRCLKIFECAVSARSNFIIRNISSEILFRQREVSSTLDLSLRRLSSAPRIIISADARMDFFAFFNVTQRFYCHCCYIYYINVYDRLSQDLQFSNSSQINNRWHGVYLKTYVMLTQYIVRK